MPLPKLTIVPAARTWVVRAGGAVIADSDSPMELIDGDEASEIYFPREDVGMAFLEASERVAVSPDLGEARFFSIVTKSAVIPDVAWSYEAPLPGGERLAGLIAFDRRRVALEEV
jgi:uncharacterized protein (DUF427 family)